MSLIDCPSDMGMISQEALKINEKKWIGEMPILYNFCGEANRLTAVHNANCFLQYFFIGSAVQFLPVRKLTIKGLQ